MLEGIGFNIKDGISSVGIRITWLSHAAGVDNLASAIELALLAILRRLSLCLAVLIDLFINHRLMCVSDKAVGCLKMWEIQRRNQWLKDIFPYWFAGATMCQCVLSDDKRRRQCFKIRDIFPREGFLRPCDRFT